MTTRIVHGDCIEVMAGMEPGSIDAIVTDPPYHLTSIVKRFAKANIENEAFAATNPTSVYKSLSTGFMGKKWDGGDVVFRPETWRLAFNLLKPGGHMLVFSSTRTYHHMACAVEDAGFEIRDQIMWLYGSGFPKSHDVSKAIDRAADVEREITGHNSRPPGWFTSGDGHDITIPATDAAREWDGWGTALKPACEPIVMARKPLDGTVAENVQAHGTGALNVVACSVDEKAKGKSRSTRKGRWPANVIHDGSPEVMAAFAMRAARETSRGAGANPRFFYCAKASAKDRAWSRHPTVKPVKLIAYLCRLITPPGGTVLDPFAGSGPVITACEEEGFNCVVIEREDEYIQDLKARCSDYRMERRGES